MSQMVLIYHPLLAETQLPLGTPRSVTLSAVNDWAARGWLLADPGGTPPPPGTPWYARTEADAKFLTVVNHGSNASVARPAGAVSVRWIGSVEPLNMAEGVDELIAVAA